MPKKQTRAVCLALDYSPLVLHSGCEPEWRLLWARRGEDSRGGRPLHLRSLLPQPRREETATSSKLGTVCCSFGKQLADTLEKQEEGGKRGVLISKALSKPATFKKLSRVYLLSIVLNCSGPQVIRPHPWSTDPGTVSEETKTMKWGCGTG